MIVEVCLLQKPSKFGGTYLQFYETKGEVTLQTPPSLGHLCFWGDSLLAVAAEAADAKYMLRISFKRNHGDFTVPGGYALSGGFLEYARSINATRNRLKVAQMTLNVGEIDLEAVAEGRFYDHNLRLGFAILRRRGLVNYEWLTMGFSEQAQLLRSLATRAACDLKLCQAEGRAKELAFNWTLLQSLEKLAVLQRARLGQMALFVAGD